MILTKNGIMYREWKPSAPPRAVFVAVHGLGAHSGRWDFFGAFCAERGFAVYAIELKGFGMTGGVRGHVDSLDTYYADIEKLGRICRDEHPGRRVFLVGESMGGLIAYLMAVSRGGVCDGLICMSPAFRGIIPFGAAVYADLFVSYYLNPTKQIRLPFTSAMCTRDEGYRAVMDASAEENRLGTAKTLGAIFLAQQYVRLTGQACAVPVLFLLSGDDKLVDPRASEEVFARLRAPDKTVIRYPGMYHALSVDCGREKVFADILEWAAPRLGR